MSQSPTGPPKSAPGRFQPELAGLLALLVVTAVALAAAGGRGRPAELAALGLGVLGAYLAGKGAVPVVAGAAGGAVFLVEAAFGRLDAAHLPATVAAMAAAVLLAVLAGRIRDETAPPPKAQIGERRRPTPGSLEYELRRSLRHTRYFSLLVARPDRLTGTQSRDEQILADVAAIVLEQLRGTDAVSRRGARDFWVILPETPRDAALVVGERVRLALGATRDGEGVSISIGIASFPDDGLAARDLALAAEWALQRAVDLGGNRTVTHSVRGDAAAGWSVAANDRVA